MKQKTGLTLEQHKELADELIKMENRFSEIWKNLSSSYPKRTRIGAKNLCTIIHNINHLKCTLETLMSEDSKKWSADDRKGIGPLAGAPYFTVTKAGNEQEHSPCNHEN